MQTFTAKLVAAGCILIMGLTLMASNILGFGAYAQKKKEPAIYINPVRFSKKAADPWNNIVADPKNVGLMAKNLLDENGNATGVSIYMEHPTSYPFSKTPNEGSDKDGIFPSEVISRGWGSKTPWEVKISGLQPNYKYTITLFASQRSYEGDAAQYEINGIRVLYEGLIDNAKNVLKLTVPSDKEGVIRIKADKVDGSLSSLTALVIEDADGNYVAPETYSGDGITLSKAEAFTKPAARPAGGGRPTGGSYYTNDLANKAAAISYKRLVRPDSNPKNKAIEMYGGYEVDWANPNQKTPGSANIHNPESAWNLQDVEWKNGKLAGLNTPQPQYYFKQKFQVVKQSWKDLSTYYYMNRETCFDTVVFYQADNRQINPGSDCNTWYSLWASKDDYTWVKLLDSITFERSNRWKGYPVHDPNFYRYLRLKVETSDPNLYHGCKTNSALIKMLASGEYRGGLITTFLKAEDLPTAVDKKNTFNEFFGTNAFASDPDTLRAQFGIVREYMSYGDFSNEVGGKFFINQNTNGQYNTHYGDKIKFTGPDGYAVRFLKNDIVDRNLAVKKINPNTKILYCVQQGANWLVNQKAKQQGGWYYWHDENNNKEVDYPEEFLPYSTISYLLNYKGGLKKGYPQSAYDMRKRVTEYRVHPEGYDHSKEVMDWWTKDGKLSGWIKRYINDKDPEHPHFSTYNRGMRIPWDKQQALADPHLRDSVLSDPRTYAYDAAFFYNLTAVHGPNKVDENTLWVQPGQGDRTGTGAMDMLEWENETDQDWHGPFAHMWARWCAAYMSAIMDGNMGEIPGPLNNNITGYMCAAPMLDFLYQGTTKDGCADIKLALDALVALRTKRKAELNAKGITKHPGNGMPLYILPPNFWANWHHYSGTSGGQRDAQYIRFPDSKDEKGLTAEDDSIYHSIREQTAWLKSFYPQVNTIITEWGVGGYSGGKFAPLKQDFGKADPAMASFKDSIINYYQDIISKEDDKKVVSRAQRDLRDARKMEMYRMVAGVDMYVQQARWLIRGSLEIWFSGLDNLTQYWLSDRGAYYDSFSWDESQRRLMPDHEKKWWSESRNNYTTFTGMGLYGNPRFGHGGYPAKTSAYAFHNLKKIIGNNVAIKREYLNPAEKIKSFVTYNKEKDYYAMIVFKATSTNQKTPNFRIKLPTGATEVEYIRFVVDNYTPEVEKVSGNELVKTITEEPVIIKYKLKNP